MVRQTLNVGQRDAKRLTKSGVETIDAEWQGKSVT